MWEHFPICQFAVAHQPNFGDRVTYELIQFGYVNLVQGTNTQALLQYIHFPPLIRNMSMKKKSSFKWKNLRETQKHVKVTNPNPTVFLCLHITTLTGTSTPWGVRCFLHTGHKHGAHCQLCSTPSMHSCRWRENVFVNIFESTPYSVMYKTQKSNREHRLWDFTSRKWRWRLRPVCLQIYSFSHTWMIPEWNQELQMNTPGHLGLPAARVHVVT